jgi:hypothetical protein
MNKVKDIKMKEWGGKNRRGLGEVEYVRDEADRLSEARVVPLREERSSVDAVN